MKYMAAVLMSFCILLSTAPAVAATPADDKPAASAQAPDTQQAKESPTAEAPQAALDNRASMLSILLVAGVMIVVVK